VPVKVTEEEHHRDLERQGEAGTTSVRRPGQDRGETSPAEDRSERGPAAGQQPVRRGRDDGRVDQQPDVLLDVPVLKVDEINLEVEDLQARVSLQAQVLDLLKLNVGADVSLGRVSLGIKGVEAAALLKVRLDNVSAILGPVISTLDENPQILGDVGGAVEQVGQHAGEAVEQVGEGTGSAGSVGDEVGEAAGKLGEGGSRGAAGPAEEAGDVAGNAGQAAGDTRKAATARKGRTAERTTPRGRQVPSSRRDRRR
jgi:hypothetical protein